MSSQNTQCLYQARQVREGEVVVAKAQGVSLYQLMERAGAAAFALLIEQYPSLRELCVVCGKGNNGGDGYVVARLAQEHGMVVHLVQVGEPERLQGDAREAMLAWQRGGGTIMSEKALPLLLNQCDVVVDALLGTGLSGSVRSELVTLIDALNHSGKPVLSIDIPSGLCADSGQILGAAVHAAHTITFIGIKQGLMTGQAKACRGKLHFAGLEVAEHFARQVKTHIEAMDKNSLADWLPKRSPVAHKGDHGKLLLMGGNRSMAGAIRLAAGAAARSGAGLLVALTHPESALPLQVSCPEVMTAAWMQNSAELEKRVGWADVLVAGPGMGLDEWAKSLWLSIKAFHGPCVLDADGLNWLARHPDHNDLRVITPHPGEAARLLGCSVAEIEADRFAAVQVLQAQYGGVAVLKGAGTLICDGNKTYVCDAGNPGMASGGMGDVLAGVIGALLAQKLPLLSAARLGVLLHSYAADLCAQRHGEIGLLASDLPDEIRRLLNGKA
ncbi:NAD(P)H-hydrate dehydratase [Vibrio navarrensis]|nr:NAD(P)H-hydrate dehydratase [Vibrio navarrensis]EJL6568036.1 NAD(P)H-hydrate dehydratase [Vibrio navarrensis]